MPTYEPLERFSDDLKRLSPSERAAFSAAVAKLVADLRRGQFRKGLRVKRVEREPGVWEMTWAADGRATFHYGASILPGEPHVVWRRIGSHDILDDP